MKFRAERYIGHGIRSRAQDLVTLELGPETELERITKLTREVVQERFTLLDRTLLVRAKEGVLAITTEDEADHRRHALHMGRLKTLERMGLANEKTSRRLAARCKFAWQAPSPRGAGG